MELKTREHLVRTNGIRLHMIEAGEPRAPLVVLLHGFPEFWYGWRRQIPFLAREGYRVWVPDQRGYNLSDKPREVAAYDVDVLVDDVLGLMAAAGRTKAAIVGHDWGGLVGWWLALRHPERVERLAILNVPHPAVMRRHLLTNPAQMLRSWYALSFQVPFLPEHVLGARGSAVAAGLLAAAGRHAFTRRDLALYREAWEQPGAWKGMVNWYRAAARRPRRRLPAERVTVPTLLVWGAKDRYLGEELVRPSLDLCDDAELVRIPDAGHFVQHEAATRVNKALGRFLRGEPQLKRRAGSR